MKENVDLTTLHPTRAAGVRFDWPWIKSKERRLTEYGGGFAAQQILSSLTNIFSLKMCFLYTEYAWLRNRNWTASAHSKVISILCILIAAPWLWKWYAILECLRDWTQQSQEWNGHIAGAGGNGQKFSWSRIKKTSYKNTMNNDCRKQTPNPGHLGRFRNPSRMHFLGPKEYMVLRWT